MMGYTQVRELAIKYDKTLKANDFDPQTFVFVNHDDGTFYHFRSAFFLETEECMDEGWIMVFTEHHGFHVFSKGGLDRYGQCKLDTSKKLFPMDKIS